MQRILNNKKLMAKMALTGLILAFCVLLILPADFFDEGQTICISVLLLDKKCYGCGMTRGIQHLIHGEFAAAYNFNKLSFIVFPLAVYLIATEIYKMLKTEDKK